jgi:hypothetical protein
MAEPAGHVTADRYPFSLRKQKQINGDLCFFENDTICMAFCGQDPF